MNVCQIKIEGFRNLVSQTVNFLTGHASLPAKVVVIYGDNGSGKTSFLESMFFVGRAKSFRTTQVENLVAFNHLGFTSVVQLLSDLSPDLITIGVSKEKRSKVIAKLDGSNIHKVSELAKSFPILFLGPETFDFISGGPGIRRAFLDFGLFHVKHSYQDIWVKWKRVLNQRNALLRKLKQEGNRGSNDLEIWDSQFVYLSEALSDYRKFMVSELQGFWNRNHENVNVGHEIKLNEASFTSDNSFTLSYYPGYSEKSGLEEQLRSSRDRDLRTGYTNLGPQKGDLLMHFGNIPARDLLSRGQQKRAIMELSLCQLELLKAFRKEKCVVLIDDLSSELDINNQQRLLETLILSDYQIIFTALSKEQAVSVLGEHLINPGLVTMFHVKHGLLNKTYP